MNTAWKGRLSNSNPETEHSTLEEWKYFSYFAGNNFSWWTNPYGSGEFKLDTILPGFSLVWKKERM